MATLISHVARLLLVVLSLGACERRTEPAPPAATVATVATAATADEAETEGEAAGIHYLLQHTGGAEAADELPLIVAIHGLGDRPDRFRLLDSYPAPARVIYPRGLSPHHGGYSWFAIDPGRATSPDSETVAGIERATEALHAMVVVLRKRYRTRGKPIVTGFSQGGMLSFAMAARHPATLSLAIPIAGYLPASLWPKEGGHGFSVAALHGGDDPLLPVGAARSTTRAFRDAGFSAELIEYPSVGHSVTPAMLREVHRRLAVATRP